MEALFHHFPALFVEEVPSELQIWLQCISAVEQFALILQELASGLAEAQCWKERYQNYTKSKMEACISFLKIITNNVSLADLRFYKVGLILDGVEWLLIVNLFFHSKKPNIKKNRIGI